MSTEAFRTFLAKVQQDESLRNELRAVGGKAGVPLEAVVAFAASKGYDFKVEDVSGELTEQQLNSVAGGTTIVTWGSFLNSNTLLKIEGPSTYLSAAGVRMFKF